MRLFVLFSRSGNEVENVVEHFERQRLPMSENSPDMVGVREYSTDVPENAEQTPQNDRKQRPYDEGEKNPEVDEDVDIGKVHGLEIIGRDFGGLEQERELRVASGRPGSEERQPGKVQTVP